MIGRERTAISQAQTLQDTHHTKILASQPTRYPEGYGRLCRTSIPRIHVVGRRFEDIGLAAEAYGRDLLFLRRLHAGWAIGYSGHEKASPRLELVGLP